MHSLNSNTSRFQFAALMTLLACGCERSSDRLPAKFTPRQSITAQNPSARPIPINFILNPDVTRPIGYPEKISVTTTEAFIADKKILGQGCGGMIWEGVDCGMYDNSYGLQATPWLEKPESLSCAYAQTETGTFLSRLTLGANTYRRPDRNSEFLIWEQNYEPEQQFNVAFRILMGGNSIDRKLLLTKIDQSLVGVEIDRFEPKKRIDLKSLLKNCQTDHDSEVASLAAEICELLDVDGE